MDNQSDQSDQSNLYVVAFYSLRAVSPYSLPEKSTKAFLKNQQKQRG